MECRLAQTIFATRGRRRKTENKNKEEQTEIVSSDLFLSEARCGSSHASQCNSKRFSRTNFSRCVLPGAIVIVLAFVSTISAFAAASFQPLPYTDPFPPAATPGGTTFCQPQSSVILNENVNGVTLPFTRALPSGWQSGNGTLPSVPGSVDYAPPLSRSTRQRFSGPRQRATAAFAAPAAAELRAHLAWLAPTPLD